MIYWGINALNHGSSLAVVNNNCLISNQFTYGDELNYDIVFSALKHERPDRIFWYEQPWVKKARQLRAGQWSRALDLSVLPRTFVNRLGFKNVPITYTPHHASHAAAGYYTAPFDDCAVVVLDAIGEFESATVWHGRDNKLKKVWSRSYPNSLGLFYSAFTDLIGFTPVSQEHLLQEYSLSGRSDRYYQEVSGYFNGIVASTHNLHRGVRNWPYAIDSDQDRQDIAAAVQRVFEEQVDLVMQIARSLTGSANLVYMGGCAMNSKYNQRLGQQWNQVWSLSNPGDPSSSIGAILYHTQQRLEDYNVGVVKHLQISV
jgi:carbamoyltransferase